MKRIVPNLLTNLFSSISSLQGVELKQEDTLGKVTDFELSKLFQKASINYKKEKADLNDLFLDINEDDMVNKVSPINPSFPIRDFSTTSKVNPKKRKRKAEK